MHFWNAGGCTKLKPDRYARDPHHRRPWCSIARLTDLNRSEEALKIDPRVDHNPR